MRFSSRINYLQRETVQLHDWDHHIGIKKEQEPHQFIKKIAHSCSHQFTVNRH